MSALKPIVINGHGAKTNKTFKIQNHTLLTPENLSLPYILNVKSDYSIEKDFQQLKIKYIQNGHWTLYNQAIHSTVNDVNISAWTSNELKIFAHNILTNPSYWSNIDNQQGYYLDKDPNAVLVVKKDNNYLHLSSLETVDFLKKVESGTHSYSQDGKALFFYADKIGKVKVFSETTLSEILDQINQISGPKLVMLATCNASFDNKTVTYDTFSEMQDIAELAKVQNISLDDYIQTTDRTVELTQDIFEKQGFHYGPLAKNLYTQELELLAKCLLRNEYNINFTSIHDSTLNKNILYATLNDLKINVSDLLSKANFSHLHFTQEDSLLYSSKYHVHNYDYVTQVNSELTKAEKSALQDYTGMEYYDINSFLYGKNLGYGQSLIKNIFVKSLFIASGLNKILPDTDFKSKTYRGDKASYEQIQERIELIEEGGGTTDSPAFFSTSLNLYTANQFTNNCMIVFEDKYGKDISGISFIPSEKEYLLEPTKILWTGYEYVNGMHIFHARKVVPLEATNEPTEYDKSIFSEVLNWANEHGINTDFITADLKSSLYTSSEAKSSAISVDDCLRIDSAISFDNILTSSNITSSHSQLTAIDSLANHQQHHDISLLTTPHVEMVI